ncbi:MAG TPA: Rid family detoxifying hydrolase [Membranihabitans sp.]|nr:Rid family detoxifying hydrolase [Membranihabitans sp.]
MKKVNHPDRTEGFTTGAYSDGIIVDGILYVSGQASVDFKTSKFQLGTIEEETHRTMQNLKAIIEAAGSSMDHIIKCTVHLADIQDFNRYNEVYSSYFGDIKPARTTVQSVLAENLKVEIDCIAKIP